MPMIRKNRLALMPTVLALCALPQFARADAIDGEWCSEKGRRINIAGSSYALSGGAKAEGAYTRHSFAFAMPAGEPDAGKPVDMVLQGEARIRVRIGESEPEVWRRCPPGIS